MRMFETFGKQSGGLAFGLQTQIRLSVLMQHGQSHMKQQGRRLCGRSGYRSTA